MPRAPRNNAPSAPAQPMLVRLALAPEMHRRLRIVAASVGKPMAELAREVVEAAIVRMEEEAK